MKLCSILIFLAVLTGVAHADCANAGPVKITRQFTLENTNAKPTTCNPDSSGLEKQKNGKYKKPTPHYYDNYTLSVFPERERVYVLECEVDEMWSASPECGGSLMYRMGLARKVKCCDSECE